MGPGWKAMCGPDEFNNGLGDCISCDVCGSASFIGCAHCPQSTTTFTSTTDALNTGGIHLSIGMWVGMIVSVIAAVFIGVCIYTAAFRLYKWYKSRQNNVGDELVENEDVNKEKPLPTFVNYSEKNNKIDVDKHGDVSIDMQNGIDPKVPGNGEQYLPFHHDTLPPRDDNAGELGNIGNSCSCQEGGECLYHCSATTDKSNDRAVFVMS